MALDIVLLVIGLALLVKGADWFVDGGAGTARLCKISPLVIGLTVVAFGTSMPELAVSVTSAIQKSTDIAIGNVVGSNIVNILLILGLSALMHDLPVQKESLKLDLPVLLLASVLIIGLGYWGSALQWWDGLIMLAVFAGYMFVLLRTAMKKQRLLKAEGVLSDALPGSPEAAEGEIAAQSEISEEQKSALSFGKRAKLWYRKMSDKKWFLILLIAVGLGMVVGGGTLLVNSARDIAERFGVSERIIGLTIVAIGTSLPELVTSVVAALKKETDIAVGNVIGSNIFNIFVVAGVSSLFYPLAFTTGNLIDACVALGAAAVLYLLALFKGHKLGKFAGVFMILCYAGYFVYLFTA